MPRLHYRGPFTRSTRLTGVALGNFKAVRGADVAIRPLTVVAGVNSAGKSSLIQAVLALTQVARRRGGGQHFSLNDELARLGTFDALRHQAADPAAPVRLLARFSSDERELRRSSPFIRNRAARDDSQLLDGVDLAIEITWAVELDQRVEGQIGSAQIAAVEATATGVSGRSAARVERSKEAPPGRLGRMFDADPDERAFIGTLQSEGSVAPVLHARISRGHVVAYYGQPPEPAARVRDWFRAIDVHQNRPPQHVSIGYDERFVADSTLLIGQDHPAPVELADWYRMQPAERQESFEAEVLAAFRDMVSRRTRPDGEPEPLRSGAADVLIGAQQTAARYLADSVHYVGPLRNPPHEPFGTGPDPDSGDVGVAGQYAAAVLRALGAKRGRFPLPGGPPAGAPVALSEAVDRWMAYLGLADGLTVREDTPLVLAIDLVPPGLSEPVGLGAVGVGVSQVLPVVVQCLAAGPGALVVLEQPELHLHPAAQQLLADFLVACVEWGQQILVESHSEYLVLRLRRRIAEDATDRLREKVGILFAERTNGATTYRNVELTETGSVTEWPPGFFDQGPEEAHQLLVAGAERRRSEGKPDAQ